MAVSRLQSHCIQSSSLNLGKVGSVWDSNQVLQNSRSYSDRDNLRLLSALSHGSKKILKGPGIAKFSLLSPV